MFWWRPAGLPEWYGRRLVCVLDLRSIRHSIRRHSPALLLSPAPVMSTRPGARLRPHPIFYSNCLDTESFFERNTD